MQSSGNRPIRVLVAFLAVATAALGLFAGSSDTQALDNFDVSYNIKNCNALPPTFGGGLGGTDVTRPGGGASNGIADCLEDPAIEAALSTNAVTDTTTSLCLPGRTNFVDCPASSFAPNLGARNFSSIINFIPASYQINGRMAGDGFGADVPYGVLAGGGDNTVNLTAALNSIDCTGTFPVPFLYYTIALPSIGVAPQGTPGAPSVFGSPDPRLATNIAWSRDEGKKDRFGAWDVGTGTTHPGGIADDPTDNIVDNFAPFDVAEPASIPIANYPKFLLDLFDPDFIPGVGDNADGGNNLPPVVPIAVYGGLSIPTGASTDWVPLYFVQFAPGQLANGAGTWVAPHPFSRTAASLGYPNFAILNDPTATKTSVSTILDFCGMVLSKNMLLGSVGGVDRFKTPAAAGTYSYQSWVMGLRDNDGDGRENGFDTCPATADTANYPDPDTDNDGIYDTCDPDGGTVTSDFDGDGFDNRGDNCPLDDNGLAPVDPGDNGQADSELTVIGYGSAAPDGGPKTDTIGDLCETADLVANGAFQVRAIVTPKCLAGVDADRDGYCVGDKDTGADAATACSDNLDNDGDTKVNDGCPAVGPAETFCDEAPIPANPTAKDSDGDGVINDGCPASGPKEVGDNQAKHNAWTAPLTGAGTSDVDVDTALGFRNDWQETFMGTDATQRCAANTTANNESGADRWPFDFNDDRAAGLSDILAYIPTFGTVGNPRWDQNQDGSVGLTDILSFIPVFSTSCVPTP